MKKWLIGGIAVLVALVAIALILPVVIPVASYKDEIVGRVKAATGRDFAINGPLSLSFLPRFALEVEDVTFGNAPGATEKTMARLAKLQLKVQPLALLSGQLAVDSFVLIDPKIDLEVDKEGRPNWQLAAAAAQPAGAAPSAGAAKPAAAPPPAASGGGKPGASFLDDAHLGDIRLVNGTVTYFDARTAKKQQLDRINAKLALPDFGSPMQASGEADWNGKTVTLALDLATPRQFLAGQKAGLELKLAAPTVKFAFKGEVALAKELTLVGETSLDVPSLRELAVWTGGTLLPTNGGLGPFKIDGKLDLAGSKIRFSGAQIGLDAIKATGDLAFDGSGAKPYLKGELDVDRLDLNPYLPPESPKPKGPAPSGGAAGGSTTGGGATPGTAARPAPATASKGWSDEPIDLSGLGVANADFALTVGGLVFHKITIGKSALAVQLKDGKLAADLSRMELYDGSGTGKVALDGAAAVPLLQASFGLAKVQAQPLLRDAMDFERLSGNANGDVAITGHGKSERELISTLGGKGDLHFADGAIKGINIGALVRNVAGTLLDANSQKDDKTAFSEMGGTFTITNGIVDNKDLELKSPLLRVAGAGTVDLPQRTVNYRIEPKLALTTQGQGGGDAAGVMIPVVVQGPWDNLSYHPQLDGLLKQPGKALQGLENIIQGQGGTAGAAAPSGAGAAPAAPPSAKSNPGALLKGLLGGSKP